MTHLHSISFRFIYCVANTESSMAVFDLILQNLHLGLDVIGPHVDLGLHLLHLGKAVHLRVLHGHIQQNRAGFADSLEFPMVYAVPSTDTSKWSTAFMLGILPPLKVIT